MLSVRSGISYMPMMSLYFAYYNFVGLIRRPLRVTPAMEAGITDHIWDLKELLAA